MSECALRKFLPQIESCELAFRKTAASDNVEMNVRISASHTPQYRGADKSLARPGRKQATATKILTFASHSKIIKKVFLPTRSPRQQ